MKHLKWHECAYLLLVIWWLSDLNTAAMTPLKWIALSSIVMSLILMFRALYLRRVRSVAKR